MVSEKSTKSAKDQSITPSTIQEIKRLIHKKHCKLRYWKNKYDPEYIRKKSISQANYYQKNRVKILKRMNAYNKKKRDECLTG